MKLTPLSLCSQCLSHEITSWLTEKSGLMKPEAVRDVYLELRDIKLREGQCIVCKNSRICEDCFNKILKVLEKSKVDENLKQEFISMFGFKF